MLDILNYKDLKKNKKLKASLEISERNCVEEIFLINFTDDEEIAEIFPNAYVYLSPQAIRAEGKKALLEDAEKLDVNGSEADLKKMIEDNDQDKFKKAAAYSSEIFPIKANLDELTHFNKPFNKPKLKGSPDIVPNYSKFLNSLNFSGINDVEYKECYELGFRQSKKFLDRAD